MNTALKALWYLVFVAGAITVLRLMSWADTGSRKLEDNTVHPSERVHEINYGKP